MTAWDDKLVDQCGFRQAQSGDFGWELEIEGDNLPSSVPGWAYHNEPSLRGGPGRAAEYAVVGTVNRLALTRRLQALQTALTQPDVIVRPTFRCSTHIHLNVRERTIKEIVAFVAVWTLVEPVLLRLCGPERNGNLFCLPAYDTGELPQYLSELADSLNRGHLHLRDRGKYAALNLDHLWDFGSLEARCFPPSIDVAECMKWVSWLTNMKTLAADFPPPFTPLVDRGLEQPFATAENIFGPAVVELPPEELVELMMLGCEHVHEIDRAVGTPSDLPPQGDTISPGRPALRPWR